MNCYEFEDIFIGMEESFSVCITEKMLRSFLSITQDTNPLHNDEQYAINKGYSGKVVYGMLTAAFLSTLAGVYLPGEKSLIYSIDVDFTKPVFIGDVLTIIGQVNELDDRFRSMKIK